MLIIRRINYEKSHYRRALISVTFPPGSCNWIQLDSCYDLFTYQLIWSHAVCNTDYWYSQSMTKNGHSCPQLTLHHPKRPQNTSHGYATWYCVMLDHPGAFSEATGATLASEKAPGWPNMAYNHVLCPCEMFKGHFGSCRDILGHEGIFWVMKFLHCRAILCHELQFLVIKVM